MTSSAHKERAHPTPAKYVAIALILAAITLVEVAIVYMDFLADIVGPVLIILSAAKFALVVMFFMHLRFDNRLFSTIFVTGLFLATGVLITLLALFRVIIGG
ncbi:MAG: cytochrome C oxidase subunit IV family protein [Chloroflexi bacterium]|nr:cytochrome C oxidase subunit IV family protein [Chloroflexota bacterium]